MIVVVLVVLGLCFGSFVNALVWRLYKQSQTKNKKSKTKYSISKGRSQCVDCEHQLGAKDLIPIISWLSLGGRCRYCKKPISWQYPAVEGITALLFVCSYLFWPVELDVLGKFQLIIWLVALIGLVALIVYDLRWMILPNRILLPLALLGVIGLIVTAIDLKSWQIVADGLIAVLVGGGFFYFIFQVSKGRWIGGGDVKLGFVLGLLLGEADLMLLVLFLASLIGTVAILPAMAMGKVTPKTRIPFGPFLIISAIIAMLWGHDIASWYINLTLGV